MKKIDYLKPKKVSYLKRLYYRLKVLQGCDVMGICINSSIRCDYCTLSKRKHSILKGLLNHELVERALTIN